MSGTRYAPVLDSFSEKTAVAHNNFTSFLAVSYSHETTPEQVRPVPKLTDEDVKALTYLGSSGEFTLEKAAAMYAGVKSLRAAAEK